MTREELPCILEPATRAGTLDPEAEAVRALEAFESVGATRSIARFVEDRTLACEAWSADSADLKREIRACLERNARGHESFILGFYDEALIQVDDCDDAVRARLAPFAFLTYCTSPGRYQAWLSLTDTADHRVIRHRLFSRLAPTGANGTPCGGTRWPGTLNCKAKHRRPDGSFPVLTIESITPGRRVTPGELEGAGLLAPKAPPGLGPLFRAVLPRAAGITRLTRAAAFWNRRKVLILQYGGVTRDSAYPLRLENWGHVRAEQFAAQLDYLRRYCRVISLSGCLEAIRRGHRLPDYSVVLTFDEGYRNFFSAAAPLLRARGLPATIFVVPERLKRESPAAEPEWTPCDDEQYLSWSEIHMLRRQGFEVGVNLPHRSTFPAYSVDAAKLALTRGYEQLVRETQCTAPPLAFRKGESVPALVDHARRLGYSCALRAAEAGMNAVSGGPFALRRLIFDKQSPHDTGVFAADVTGLKLWWTRLARHEVVVE